MIGIREVYNNSKDIVRGLWRHKKAFVGVLFMLFLAQACSNEQNLGAESDSSQSLASLPGLVQVSEGVYQFEGVSGSFDSVDPVSSCDGGKIANYQPPQNILEAISICDGPIRSLDLNHLQETPYPITFSVKTTIPGLQINPLMQSTIVTGLISEGILTDQTKTSIAYVLVHRDDGEDGLPGGNLYDGEDTAVTVSYEGTSATLSSVPISENSMVSAIGGLSAELCQAVMAHTGSEVLHREARCNGYASAVVAAWLGWEYEQYEFYIDNTQFTLEGDSQPHSRIPVNEETYYYLQDRFSMQPDLFVPVK
ncbi:hypothetical protein KC717_05705 [Candidatus Dojkabacteria bacterium]|uniref:Uncharacterized protein n=1 Tax=Candidatus Dojkabacteria bacterium TaxID=2099670 RepID=A0A955L948_9BACT|nr:hypothetical protein [Candidatus Dojkabacteria bacterium]